MVFKKILFILFLFVIVSMQAQDFSKSVVLNWKTDNQQLYFQNATFLNNFNRLPIFIHVFDIGNNSDVIVEISNEKYQLVQGITLSPKQLSLIQNQIIIKNDIGIERGNALATISILPIRNNGGQIEVLSSFDLSVKPVKNNSTSRLFNLNSQNYASNSILKTGNWYKFGVPKKGVYKLDYAFLKSLGMQVDAINPTNIRIFGHRDGMLPELAGATREDDAKEIPIKVVTATASRFQAGDYVLAYLPGPEQWNYNSVSQMFIAKKHLYSDTKNFFITADIGAGARISNVNSSSLPENINVTTYDDYAFIEEDKVNIAQSGKDFLGDEFGSVTEKSYNFNLPNLVSSQSVKLRILVASNSATNSSGASFNITTDGGANGNSIFLSGVGQPYPGIFNAATIAERVFNLNNVSSNFNINLNFNRNNDFNTKGWLDFLQVNATSNLQYNGQPLYFRKASTIGVGNVSKFSIQNMNNNVEVWDVTNPFDIQKINYNLSGNIASFNIVTDSLKEFVVIENSSEMPIKFGFVANQDLHGLPQQDMLIVTRTAFLSHAQTLAQFHQNKENLRVAVVDINQVFNEFSSGTNDVTAIRNFVKMFYDRANGNTAQMPKYLLLFGDGTYENKNLGEYFLPTYQSDKTYESLDTYVADDYFGILDDNEGGDITNTSSEKIDVAVGRIPADDVIKAQSAIDKIKVYYSNASYGEWRNQGTFIADDEDVNIFINSADLFANNYTSALPQVNMDKIYLDAFQQQSGTGGQKYPVVNETVNRKLFTGSLFVNYIGHGNPLVLAKEAILTIDDINQWTNATKLPLFIAATCDYAPYDKPSEYSAGERILFKPDGGGIGLVATTRVVFASDNDDINSNFMQQMALAYYNQQTKLGDIVRIAKNLTSTQEGNRKFTLLGDPALRLAFPTYKVVPTKINNIDISLPHDTIKALSRITIEGEVQNNSNILINTFQGIAAISIYDKSKTIRTLVNDPISSGYPDGSLPKDFNLQKNIIYKGKSKVTDGKFKFSFLVPKDLDYTFGNGKISLYANSDTADASGYSNEIIIGGASDTFPSDNQGPIVEVFLNDDKFAFGGITDETPKLFSKLFDENGINTSGNGVGHDITAIIDNDTKKIYNLNDFYETNVDDISRGVVNYPFSKLSKGRHTLQVKAWDVLNNSGIGYTEFIVEEKANLALTHVLNYPNPFTTNTRFMFEHNKPGTSLDLKIEIFTVTGKVIKTITKNINTLGYRVDDITWDGLDEYGDKIGRGVYIYRISLKDESGKKVSQYQKLVILN
jgi:hypothetical protein